MGGGHSHRARQCADRIVQVGRARPGVQHGMRIRRRKVGEKLKPRNSQRCVADRTHDQGALYAIVQCRRRATRVRYTGARQRDGGGKTGK